MLLRRIRFHNFDKDFGNIRSRFLILFEEELPLNTNRLPWLPVLKYTRLYYGRQKLYVALAATRTVTRNLFVRCVCERTYENDVAIGQTLKQLKWVISGYWISLGFWSKTLIHKSTSVNEFTVVCPICDSQQKWPRPLINTVCRLRFRKKKTFLENSHEMFEGENHCHAVSRYSNPGRAVILPSNCVTEIRAVIDSILG